jgi:type III pantothenate kinase
MILCIDSGNSRIKFAIWADARWCHEGALDHADCAELTRLKQGWPEPERIMLANVAGAGAEAAIRQALGDWARRLTVVSSSAAAGGVRNAYRNPAQLGVDRWCALIGARTLCPGALLVVMAGTATTIDTLDAAGHFLGGLILPGQQMMLSALARNTAGLPFAEGQHVDWPQSTDDAIVSGVIEAQLGAIERAWARLPGDERLCLISGGNAALLAKYLVIPVRQADNLPLLGLKILASETSPEN